MSKLNVFIILRRWLPLAVLAFLLAALVYAGAQHNLRASANDPQIQMAEDSAAVLASGEQSPSAVVGDRRIDIDRSLAPFLIIFDDGGQPLASSARLDGQIPLPPAGVFTDVKARGAARFTWQPQPGVRSAAVVMHYAGTQSGFVLAGRSLREVEIRESEQLALAGMAWLAALGGTLVAVVGVSWLKVA